MLKSKKDNPYAEIIRGFEDAIAKGVANSPSYQAMCYIARELPKHGRIPAYLATQVASTMTIKVPVMSRELKQAMMPFMDLISEIYAQLCADFGVAADSMLLNMSRELGFILE